MTELYKRLKAKQLSFYHVCEVGVYLPQTSNIIDFIQDGIPATLVEADPEVVEKIKQSFKNYPITVHAVAVWDYNGLLTLSKASASTFVSALKSSPALENDRYQIKQETTVEVPCQRFSEIDDGTIDLLSVDIEGSEWYVLKYLTSRPKVISLETHGKFYTNPFMAEIEAWMKNNKYEIWYKDATDSVYIQANTFPIGLFEKIALRLRQIAISLRKKKKYLKISHKKSPN
ncbi:FkbM family methyltransferase [Tellurirhabdus bombi]|uniref:FkbM family methyltransferase n=1 Tax=Tellurirhabdus bombi TaxID=2907205 RepID=UPI001F31FDE1|nr:FkbM family methyltransferase [Tellurirhabdus bombi]